MGGKNEQWENFNPKEKNKPLRCVERSSEGNGWKEERGFQQHKRRVYKGWLLGLISYREPQGLGDLKALQGKRQLILVRDPWASEGDREWRDEELPLCCLCFI